MSLPRCFAFVTSALLGVSMTGGLTLAEDWFGDPIVTPLDRSPYRIAVADFDRDETDDVVANIGGPSYALYRGDPSGILELVQTIPGVYWGSFQAFDENQDEWPDLIGEEPGDLFRVWRNDGVGMLVDSGITIPGYNALSTGFLPGDPYQDVMVQAGADSLLVYYGGPGGLSLDTDSILLRAAGELPGTYRIYRAALFDLNLDGVPDVFSSGELYADWLPEMRWKLGQGDGSFGGLQQYGYYSPLSSFDPFDIRDMNGDGDPEIAVMWVGFEWGNTQIYTYRRGSGTLDYQGLAPGLGVPLIEHLDGDALADVIMADYGTITIFRNRGGNSYSMVQSFPGRSVALGSILGLEARDLINIRQDPSEINVRPSLVIPASSEDWSLDRGPRLVVVPSLASSQVRIELLGSKEGNSAGQLVDVYDVNGRRVTHITLRGARATWNLSNEANERLGSGVYWLQTRGQTCQSAIARVYVAR